MLRSRKRAANTHPPTPARLSVNFLEMKGGVSLVGTLSTFSVEIIGDIFSKLDDGSTLAAAACVCQKWRLTEHQSRTALWKRLTVAKWREISHADADDAGVDWRIRYYTMMLYGRSRPKNTFETEATTTVQKINEEFAFCVQLRSHCLHGEVSLLEVPMEAGIATLDGSCTDVLFDHAVGWLGTPQNWRCAASNFCPRHPSLGDTCDTYTFFVRNKRTNKVRSF